MKDLTMTDTAIPETVTRDNGTVMINFEKKKKEFEILAQIKILQSSANAYSIQPDPAFLVWFDSIEILREDERWNIFYIGLFYYYYYDDYDSNSPLNPQLRAVLRNRTSHSVVSRPQLNVACRRPSEMHFGQRRRRFRTSKEQLDVVDEFEFLRSLVTGSLAFALRPTGILIFITISLFLSLSICFDRIIRVRATDRRWPRCHVAKARVRWTAIGWEVCPIRNYRCPPAASNCLGRWPPRQVPAFLVEERRKFPKFTSLE